MKLSTKLLSVSTLILGTWVGFGYVSVSRLSALASHSMEVQKSSAASLSDLGKIAMATKEQRLWQYKAFLMSSAELKQISRSRADAASRDARVLLSRYLGTIGGNRLESDLAARLEAHWTLYQSQTSFLANLLAARQDAQANRLFIGDMRHTTEELDKTLHQIIDLNELEARDAAETAQAAVARSRGELLILISVGALASILVGILVVSSVKRRLGRLADSFATLQRGLLDELVRRSSPGYDGEAGAMDSFDSIRILDRSQDEIGNLGSVYNHMVNGLQRLLNHFNESLIRSSNLVEAVSNASKRNRRFATMLDGMAVATPVGFLVTSADGKEIAFANPQFYRLLGCSEPTRENEALDSLQRVIEECSSTVHDLNVLHALLVCVSDRNAPDPDPVELRMRNGVTLWCRVAPMDHAEEIGFGRFYTFEDITAQKLAEIIDAKKRRAESFITNLATGLVQVDAADLPDALDQAFASVCKFSHTTSGKCYVAAASQSNFEVRMAWPPEPESPPHRPIGRSAEIDDLLTKGVVVVGSVLAAANEIPISPGQDTLIVPMTAETGPIGFLLLDVSERSELRHESDHLRLISALFANAIKRSQAEEQIRKLASRRLRESEQRLRAVVDHAPIAIIALDTQGRVSLCEGRAAEALVRILGPIQGKKASLAFRDYPSLVQDVMRARSGECFTSTVQIDGQIFESRFQPLDWDRGERLGTVLIFTDVSERVRLQAKLTLNQRMEGIGHLSAGVAHEINTPLQYIRQNASFLKDSFESIVPFVNDCLALLKGAENGSVDEDKIAATVDAAAKIDLGYVVEQIPLALEESIEGLKRVSEIVKALKDFSNQGAAEMALADLNQALENVVQISRGSWISIADVELDLDDRLPIFTCFQAELNQAFLGLFENAVDAVENAIETGKYHKGKISVSTRADGDWVEIAISDDALGIPLSDQPKVFDMFYTTKDPGKGTGKGLSLIHSAVVEKHRGSIDLESSPGEGSTFRLRIPIFVERIRAA